MIDLVLFYIHHGLTLLAGVVLSAAFSGVKFTKKNCGILFLISLLCGASQLSAFLLFGEKRTWELYPAIVHAPLVLLLWLLFRKRIITAAASVFLAYLCCQPSKWFGLLANTFLRSSAAVWCVKITVMLLTD